MLSNVFDGILNFLDSNRSRMSRKRQASNEPQSKLTIDLTNRNEDLPNFPHPFQEGGYGVGCQPKTLTELNMIRVSGTIRSKPKWFEKFKDPAIRKKWKEETLEQDLLTDKQIDYVLAELEYYDSLRDHSMEMSAVDDVWQSDQLIPDEIKQALITSVYSLENVPEKEKDWHPGTNQQILDLVHPSLFCYVNETTRIINEKDRLIALDNAVECIGLGETVDINAKSKKHSSDVNYTKSRTYQWLPAEFNVSKEGQVTIESYINNLHPVENKELYGIIGQIFERFIPLFNKTLTDSSHILEKPNRIHVDPYSWYAEASPEDEEDDNDNYNRSITVPDVNEFQMPPAGTSSIDLRGRKLQVIVKLANIILTPDNPSYPGGAWHVEGMENEHIVATGIYYYSSSNITESNLQFRTVIQEPNYEQGDYRGVGIVYGLGDDLPLNQSLGELITQEDRCIAFPNIYQHRVAPFQLQDPTQSGERKILVFFLVDPTIQILSTAHVPPQQAHWLISLLRSMKLFNQLPVLVLEKIVSFIDFPMSINQAKQHRESLMTERKYFIQQQNELLFERPFSLCEH